MGIWRALRVPFEYGFCRMRELTEKLEQASAPSYSNDTFAPSKSTNNMALLRESLRTFIELKCSLHKSRIISSFPNFFFHPAFNDKSEQEKLEKTFAVYLNFINEKEEENLVNEIEPVLKRLRYEADHWDSAILGYRETEKRNWGEDNSKILSRVRENAFPDGSSMPLVHVLDLKADGVIKPHVDSIKFCGSTIAGLSLLTDSVMRLSHEKNPSLVADVLLPRRSLYIMTGCARYDYAHAILGGSESEFNGRPVVKTRRISVISRNDPNNEK